MTTPFRGTMETHPTVTPEALMAVTGIRRAMETAQKRITLADKNAAEMLPREIRRACTRFVSAEGGPRKIGHVAKFDYRWALDHITDAMSEDEASPQVNPALLERLADRFREDDADLASGYLLVVQRMLPYLHRILPIRTEALMAQTLNFDPSDTEIARFRRAFDIADDPMVVMRDLEGMMLVADQVMHVAELYPETYAIMKSTMAIAMTDALARKKSWKLDWRRERMVQELFQSDTFSPDLARELQAGFAKQDETKNPPSPPTSTSKAATMVQTKTEAVSVGDLRR